MDGADKGSISPLAMPVSCRLLAGAKLLGTTGEDFEGDPSNYEKHRGDIRAVTDTTGTGTPPVLDRTFSRCGSDPLRHSGGDGDQVLDREDDGDVTINVREPQELASQAISRSNRRGRHCPREQDQLAVVQERRKLAAGDTNEPNDDDADLDPDRMCADVDDNVDNPAWVEIDAGATSPTYTPPSYTFDHDNDGLNEGEQSQSGMLATEVGYCLRVTA